MNDYDFLQSEQRNQTLVVVEGEHEKKILLKILLACFPEVLISDENIHVYSADIYDLYYDIEKEYEENWFENDLEIDIPMLISRRHNIEPQLVKKNFTNIILMFDYEHHDTWFSDDKIQRMQKHFNSIIDDGILYISYPMIEAFKHLISIPDAGYLNRTISVKCRPGKEYKQIVEHDSIISKYFKAYDHLSKYLSENIENINQKQVDKLVYDIFSVREKKSLKVHIAKLLIEFNIKDKIRNNMEYAIANALHSFDYFDDGLNYWEKLRQLFMYITEINIEKAVKIQNQFGSVLGTAKERYLSIDWTKILYEQNKASSDDEIGVIWVLCTCITLLAEYKFYWEMKV